MKRCPPLSSRSATIAAALLIAMMAVTAFGQIQSGNIYGHVQQKDGAPLPGVTVTLSGVGAPQSFITDTTGAFRFLSLSPGTYQVKAELAGFGTATRQGIGVNLGRNADVTMTLNPSVAESITVTAEAPVLDVRKTGTGATVTKVELEKVPSARDPWVILQQTPSVIMDRNNVGGNESGQQSVYVSKGAVGTQSTWNIDGVNITDFAATGSSPSYYDFDTFEEMQITTGGTDPRIMTPGTQLNMVTKRGTNDFKGSARAFRTDNSYQADPRIPDEAKGYLKAINQINNIADKGAEIGGPIWRDKAWFWGSFGKQNIDILTATVVAGSRFRDKTELKSENLKLNAQPVASNSLTAVDQYNAKIKFGRNVGATRFPETAWNQDNSYKKGTGSLTDPTLWKIEDTQIIGSSLYLTGLYSKVQGGFQLIADNGNTCTSFACGLDVTNAYRDFRTSGDQAWHRSYESVTSLRPQTQYRIDGSAFANTGNVNHEFKFGFGYRDASVTSQTGWPGDQYVYRYSPADVPAGNTGVVALMRLPVYTYEAKSTDLYAGDTMLFGNLTLQAGLRYDMQKGSDGEGVGRANTVAPNLLPAITFAASPTLKWNNISPRLGLTYTLGANKQTLLRAAYSRYINQMTSGVVAGVSPGAASYLYYYFNDVNANDVYDPSIDKLNGLQGSRGIDPSNPAAAPVPFKRWDSDLKAPTTDEIIFGVEHELISNFSIGANVTFRKLNDFIWQVPERTRGGNDFYTSADYVQKTTAPFVAPNGQTITLPYYELKSDVPVPKYYVYANRPDYSQSYKGLELTATKRMSNRWMLRGNVTLQDWTQDVGANGVIDPTLQRVQSDSLSGGIVGTGGIVGGSACPACDGSDVLYRSTGSGSKGNVFLNSKWASSITGIYQIPVIETAFGFNINSRQGYSLPYVYRQATREGAKTLMVYGKDVSRDRLDTVTQLDVRLSKDFRISRVGLTVSADGFNILNSNTILQRDLVRIGTATSNHVTEVLSPRVFRLGARVTF